MTPSKFLRSSLDTLLLVGQSLAIWVIGAVAVAVFGTIGLCDWTWDRIRRVWEGDEVAEQ